MDGRVLGAAGATDLSSYAGLQRSCLKAALLRNQERRANAARRSSRLYAQRLAPRFHQSNLAGGARIIMIPPRRSATFREHASPERNGLLLPEPTPSLRLGQPPRARPRRGWFNYVRFAERQVLRYERSFFLARVRILEVLFQVFTRGEHEALHAP